MKIRTSSAAIRCELDSARTRRAQELEFDVFFLIPYGISFFPYTKRASTPTTRSNFPDKRFDRESGHINQPLWHFMGLWLSRSSSAFPIKSNYLSSKTKQLRSEKVLEALNKEILQQLTSRKAATPGFSVYESLWPRAHSTHLRRFSLHTRAHCTGKDTRITTQNLILFFYLWCGLFIKD